MIMHGAFIQIQGHGWVSLLEIRKNIFGSEYHKAKNASDYDEHVSEYPE